MKRFVLAAFLKALVITVGFDLICVIYGFITSLMGFPLRAG